MKKKLIILLSIFSYMGLIISVYVAFNSTNDCDNSLKIVLISLPGLICGLVAYGLGLRRKKILVSLLIGFIFLMIKAYHLGQTAVGDC